MSQIAFAKMHGTGNDFVVIDDRDDRLDIPATAVVALCDRRFGIGADGVIRIGASTAGDAFMDYRNADGSVSEMCGNGVRVVGKFLGDRGVVGDSMRLDTRAGVKPIDLQRNGDSVTLAAVDMGPVTLEGDVELADVAQGVRVSLASTGNPHAMVLTDDVDSFDLDVIGPLIERHAKFPGGRNVPVVQLIEGGYRQRTWERGCGETLACGTAATAAFGILRSRGEVGDGARVELRGGVLQMSISAEGNVSMTGPAEQTYAGEFDAGRYGVSLR